MIKDKTYQLLILSLFFYFLGFTQNQSNIWYFGYKAGINFNTSTPTVLNDGVINTLEGSATICDNSGNLLFYTDGDTVWNKNHQIMSYGLGGTFSTTQTLIIQKPNNPNHYYIFSQTACWSNELSLFYAEVDMSSNNGLGVVISKNNFLHHQILEKMTAIKHCNNRDIWLIAFESPEFKNEGGNNTTVTDIKIHSYLITPFGIITTPVTSSFSSNNQINWDCAGQLKASPNGKYLVWDGGKGYCEYDNSTGKAFNLKEIIFSNTLDANLNYYGVEFSPNSHFFYNANFQIEVKTGYAIQYNFFINKNPSNGEPLQLAPNGKIYIGNMDSLSEIKYPNIKGPNVGYSKNTIFLNGGVSFYSLPNFTPYIFYQSPGEFSYNEECANKQVTFSLKDTVGIDSVLWIFNDNSISKVFNPVFTYTSAGSYSIKSIIYYGGTTDTTMQCVKIYGDITTFLGNDITICDKNKATLIIPYPGKYYWSTGDTTDYIKVSQNGTYWAKIKNSCGTYTDTIRLETKSCDITSLFFVPNIITPNGDGMNDNFEIIPIYNSESFFNLTCAIFNRWGEKIFFFEGKNGSWDGSTISGDEISSGCYYYVIEYSTEFSPKEYKNGFIQLIKP